MSEEQNVAVVRRLAERWNEGDTDGFLAGFADDVELITDEDWPDSGASGKAAFARYIEDWRSNWEEIKLSIEPVRVEGEEVEVRAAWQVRGASSGIDSELAFGILFTFRDGLIVRQVFFR
jgi:ketosteroid isomerase-like protein